MYDAAALIFAVISGLFAIAIGVSNIRNADWFFGNLDRALGIFTIICGTLILCLSLWIMI